jgi:hypothetical protein
MPMSNSHKYLGTNNTNYNNFAVTDISKGWAHSTITRRLNTWLGGQLYNMNMGLKKIEGVVSNQIIALSVS